MSTASERTTTLPGDRAVSRVPAALTRRRVVQAAIALGLFGTGLLQGYGWAPRSPVAFEGGALVATGDLEQVLYDPAPGGREEGPSVVEAPPGEAGHRCRRFVDGRVSGLACERSGDWRIVELRQR